MNIIIYLGHPAHFYLFKNVITEFYSKKYKVKILIKKKDILEFLCEENKLKYENILPKGRKNTSLSMIFGLIKRNFKLFKIVKKFNPNIIVGSDVALSHIGKLTKTWSLIFSEDDAEQVKSFAKLGYPFVSNILSPEICSAWKWENKKIGYNSYHELAYLSPKYFTPNKKSIEYLNNERSFFILRLSGLDAYHDEGKTGINTEIAGKIIDILSPHGRVYITSERQLESEFEKYRININPIHMHHALYYADMYIGDSQTMTAEAAVLGTPALRFNDFVGKLSYLEELEHKYELTYGIKTSEPEKLYKKIKEILLLKDRKKIWQKRREKMLKDKIDVTAFFVWFIENYPESAKIMKENPNYQERFR